MFGISGSEIIVILALALVIFGPQKLPEIASSLGKLFGTLRKHSNELRREFYNSVYTPTEDFRHSLDEGRRQLKAEAKKILEEDSTENNKPELNKPDK